MYNNALCVLLQEYFALGGFSFIGVIVSPYNRTNQGMCSEFQCLTISSELSPIDKCSKLPLPDHRGEIIGENLHCYTGYTLISFVSLQVLQFSDLWRTFNVNFIFFTSFLTDIPFSFNYGMIMQPLQSELVMRSIKMLAEKYSQDRNRVELLQPYIGTTSCLSKVGNNDLIGSCDKERPSHMRNKLGIAKCIVK